MQFTLRRGPTVQTEMSGKDFLTARIHCTISQRLSGAMVLRQHQHNIGYTAGGFYRWKTVQWQTFSNWILLTRDILHKRKQMIQMQIVLFLNKYQRLTNMCASEVVTKIFWLII